jgi:ATP-dependent Clp protease protease subunit
MMHKKLLQLLRDNAKREISALRIENEGEAVTIFLYDVIDPYFGISAEEFNRQIAGLKGKSIALRINSPGGDVFDGRAMATAIQQHGDVTVYIDGLAASAATYVALAAKQVNISEGAFFMIHNAWTFAYGNKHDMTSAADLLDKVDQSIINDYMKKTGKTKDQIVTWMDEETWFSAEEALEHGFVDAMIEAGTQQPANAWNLTAFDKAPAALTQKPAPENNLAHYRDTAERRLRLLQIA